MLKGIRRLQLFSIAVIVGGLAFAKPAEAKASFGWCYWCASGCIADLQGFCQSQGCSTTGGGSCSTGGCRDLDGHFYDYSINCDQNT